MLLVRAHLLGSFWQSLEVGLLEAVRGAHKDLQVLSLQVCWLVGRPMAGELIELSERSLAITTADQSIDLRWIECRRLRV